jgi:hypothetical protein
MPGNTANVYTEIQILSSVTRQTSAGIAFVVGTKLKQTRTSIMADYFSELCFIANLSQLLILGVPDDVFSVL